MYFLKKNYYKMHSNNEMTKKKKSKSTQKSRWATKQNRQEILRRVDSAARGRKAAGEAAAPGVKFPRRECVTGEFRSQVRLQGICREEGRPGFASVTVGDESEHVALTV